MRHSGIARRVAIWGDDLLGYGKPHPEDKWWLDLEDVDGVVQAPKKSGLKQPWIVDNE
jgi:hypothetical protein